MTAATPTASEVVDIVYGYLQPFWVELSFLIFFGLGWAFLKLDALPIGQKKKHKMLDARLQARHFDPALRKTIEAEAAGGAGGSAAVLKAWRAGKDRAPTPVELLKAVAQALLDAEPDALVKEVCQHLEQHQSALANGRAAFMILDVVARAGDEARLEELWKIFNTTLQIGPTQSVCEVLLGGYASVGNEKKVAEVAALVVSNRLKLSARAFSLTIKGFLKNSMVDAVLKQMVQMKNQGFQVPPFAVTQFVRIACEGDRCAEAMEMVQANALTLPAEAVAQLLEDCCRHERAELAAEVEKFARDTNTPLSAASYEALLKLCACTGDQRALRLFQEMQASNMRISEGLCVGMLARCAEAKFLRFAEEVAKFSRDRGGMTIAVYSALMKVYAFSGMYNKACDLYEQICKDGLEPDGVMYGCLMKFAVECGRTELSRELSKKAPSLDIQNYMSLMRAAGRDKDAASAVAVLEKLKAAGLAVDIAAYNCAIDACVSAGDMPRARRLIAETRQIGGPDKISFNTLMKGYCSAGDLRSAKGLLREMKDLGLKPDDVSYNCLINAAVSKHNPNFSEAWETMEEMEQNGVTVDHYTVSILMKALKKVKNPDDVTRALALLDRPSLNVCSDEILMNAVLETCIRHRKLQRLEHVIATYRQSGLRPSGHTYGALIKASSTLKKLDQCRMFWEEMVDQRSMEPNEIVLGCMMDALVNNGQVEKAVALFEKWKTRVPPNAIIYCTIIKGFANSQQASRALDTYHEMRKDGVKMNTVVYNAIIDSQARVGAMKVVSELVDSMGPDGCAPDAITYSTIVKAYCVSGNLDKAYEIFKGMQEDKLINDSVIYNTMLDGCVRHGRSDLADKLLEDMERFGTVPSNFTLGILVKMYGRRKQLDKAFQVVDELPRKHGFFANAQVHTCLMSACLNNNAIDRAFQVFQGLKATHSADSKAYGSLVSGCVRLGQLHKAAELVEEAYGVGGARGARSRQFEGPPLEQDALEQLMRALQQKGLAQAVGGPLIEKLHAANEPVAGRLVAALGGGQNRRSS